MVTLVSDGCAPAGLAVTSTQFSEIRKTATHVRYLIGFPLDWIARANPLQFPTLKY
jgi:hypothetical protein